MRQKSDSFIKPMQSRNWCFTLNNPEPADDLALNFDSEIWNHQVRFAVYMLETGNENQTPHYQGYLELKSSRRINYLKSRLPRAHFEARRGTRESAILYCVKTWVTQNSSDSTEPSLNQEHNSEESGSTVENTNTCQDSPSTSPIWYGLPMRPQDFLASLMNPKPKKRAERLEAIQSLLQEGTTEEEIADKDFEMWVRHYRAFREYRLMITPPRNHEVTVIVLQGPTGTGKSKWAMDNYPNAYWKQRSIWWDGYAKQETVIIDEFYGWIPFDTLLRICDRYPLLVETKGGQVNFVAKNIIITTNAIPNSWYKNVYFNSFVRRVSTWMVLRTWGSLQSFSDYSEAISHFVLNE